MLLRFGAFISKFAALIGDRVGESSGKLTATRYQLSEGKVDGYLALAASRTDANSVDGVAIFPCEGNDI